jgi:hypothetical protein
MQRLARDPFLADRFRDGIDKVEWGHFWTLRPLRFVDGVGLRPLERLVLVASIVALHTGAYSSVPFENADPCPGDRQRYITSHLHLVGYHD